MLKYYHSPRRWPRLWTQRSCKSTGIFSHSLTGAYFKQTDSRKVRESNGNILLRDGGGSIGEEELGKVMKTFGWDPKEEELKVHVKVDSFDSDILEL